MPMDKLPYQGGVQQPQQNVQPVAPVSSANPVPGVKNLQSFRDYLTNKNYNIGYDPANKNVLVNNTPYSPEQMQQYGMQLQNNSWQGTPQQYDKFIYDDMLREQGGQPTIDQTQTPLGFRDYATQAGLQIGWTPQTGPTINGVPVNLEAMGLRLQNNSYVGTPDQYNKILNAFGYNPKTGSLDVENSVGEDVRASLERAGFKVDYNNKTGEIMVNNSPVDPKLYGFVLKNDRFYGQPEVINSLIDKFKKPMVYDSQYDDENQSILDEMNDFQQPITDPAIAEYMQNLIPNMQKDFTYDPGTDPIFQAAMGTALNNINEDAAATGTMFGTGRQERATRAGMEMANQYRQQAYQEFSDQQNRLLNLANTLITWDDMQYQRGMDKLEIIGKKADFINQLDTNEFNTFKLMWENMNNGKMMALEEQSIAIAQKSSEIESAYARIDALGYVDNEASKILGIPVGTEAGWAKQEAMKQANALELSDKEHKLKIKEMEAATDSELKLIKERAKYESYSAYDNYMYDRGLASQKFGFDKELMEKQYGLEFSNSIASEVAKSEASNTVIDGVNYGEFTRGTYNVVEKHLNEKYKLGESFGMNATTGETLKKTSDDLTDKEKKSIAEDLAVLADQLVPINLLEELRIRYGVQEKDFRKAISELKDRKGMTPSEYYNSTQGGTTLSGGNFNKASSSQTKFVSKIVGGARKAREQYGVLPSITIAQAILESNWGKSSLSSKNNNLFGIKGSGTAGSASYASKEYINGKWVTPKSNFASYKNIDDSLVAHGKLLTNKRYKKVLSSKDYSEAAIELQRAGYATDPKYAEKLINIIEQYGLYKYD
jgi:flagellum-specific peptidoglycan hydrolase FlgJ